MSRGAAEQHRAGSKRAMTQQEGRGNGWFAPVGRQPLIATASLSPRSAYPGGVSRSTTEVRGDQSRCSSASAPCSSVRIASGTAYVSPSRGGPGIPKGKVGGYPQGTPRHGIRRASIACRNGQVLSSPLGRPGPDIDSSAETPHTLNRYPPEALGAVGQSGNPLIPSCLIIRTTHTPPFRPSLLVRVLRAPRTSAGPSTTPTEPCGALAEITVVCPKSTCAPLPPGLEPSHPQPASVLHGRGGRFGSKGGLPQHLQPQICRLLWSTGLKGLEYLPGCMQARRAKLGCSAPGLSSCARLWIDRVACSAGLQDFDGLNPL